MFKKIFLICVAAGMALSANSGNAAVFTAYSDEMLWQMKAGSTYKEDFESYPVGAQVLSHPLLGVSFEVLEGGGYPQIYQHPVATTPDGNKHLGNFPNGINPINQWDDIVMKTLPGATITAVGYWNGDGQPDTLFATAYDASMNVLGTIGAFKGEFAGFVTDMPVSKVVFDGDTGDGWNHLDGLQTNAIPGPASLILSLTSITLLVGIRQIRRGQSRRYCERHQG